MKIEHEIKDVKIVRRPTIAEALAPVYGESEYGKQRVDIVSGLMGGSFHKENPHYRLLHERALARDYEGDIVYRRTCALVILKNEWRLPEFHHALDEKGYYPAGTNESASYLLELKKHGRVVDTVVHLGTLIIDDQYQERRLVTREHGRAELIYVFGRTTLKPYYHVVAVKKPEKVEPPKTLFFRRKK